MNKKLILISGSPCVGKTAVGTRLFESYNKQRVSGRGLVLVRASLFRCGQPASQRRQKHVLCSFQLSGFGF